ncbi:DUF6731 family protein [Caldanaerobacter subterraneus]|uniref:Uncharacterized protein n=1 Tax=Caldanaerobacter subterraneus subsp. pacificus DSM 12653 TaxID=391606 RepID=B7R6E4_9THEO|nr:DUF6731 family protein [Caldanaerobacter subterraneus]KKC28799.1 hypothetical protein CDSM653_02185 [Caldanaerobacter subterraneus subsp. pacificus DSM 12653]
MAITRKIKFEYFEVVYRLNDDQDQQPDRLFDFLRWLKKATGLSLEARTFDYYNERARLEKFYYDDVNNYWLLNFVRLRETNIPLIGKVDQEAEPIELDDDEFIGEDVSMLYDPKLKIVMLQRNIHSLGPSGIEKYLNLLWASEKEQIYLRPIYFPNSFEKARNSKIYRKITVRFALPNDFNESSIEDSPLKPTIQSFGKFNGIIGEVTISVGQSKKENLHRETIHETLKFIENNREIIKKAQLTIKKDEEKEVEILDLFEDKLYDYLIFTLPNRQSLACEYVFQKMIEKYQERRSEIIKLVKRDE